MKCKICSNNNTKEVINLGKQPLANKYPKNNLQIKNEVKYYLKVFYCKNCRSGQISKLIDRNLMFKDYYYLSSVNDKLVNHFKKLAYKIRKSKFVIDIGSNDGILLKPLKDMGVKCLGIDPSINVGKIANKKGLNTIIGFFDKKIIKKILKTYQKPDVLVASSVVTHLKNPKEFAKNIKSLLMKDGIFILEIEYLYNFIENLEFERFYFDRPFYYSVKSIDILFKNVGMSLIDVEKIDVHGESIRCYINNGKNLPKSNRLLKMLKNENKKLNINLFNEFNKKIKIETKNLIDNISLMKDSKKKIIGYGAPARVATITNYANITEREIPVIIDDSPLKQGRFSPGKHIRIINKKNIDEKKVDTIIVFAYEYFKEIKKNFKNKKIKFYKPIPFKEL